MLGQRVLGAVAIAAMVATPLAAPAYADQADDQFISLLNQHGVPYKSASDAIKLAQSVCITLRRQGSMPVDALKQVVNKTGMDVKPAGVFIGVSALAYCPDQTPKLQ
jgi:Protein of unknown function (DUF732)